MFDLINAEIPQIETNIDTKRRIDRNKIIMSKDEQLFPNLPLVLGNILKRLVELKGQIVKVEVYHCRIHFFDFEKLQLILTIQTLIQLH